MMNLIAFLLFFQFLPIPVADDYFVHAYEVNSSSAHYYVREYVRINEDDKVFLVTLKGDVKSRKVFISDCSTLIFSDIQVGRIRSYENKTQFTGFQDPSLNRLIISFRKRSLKICTPEGPIVFQKLKNKKIKEYHDAEALAKECGDIRW
jgi:sugar lactone lactonase YvrE